MRGRDPRVFARMRRPHPSEEGLPRLPPARKGEVPQVREADDGRREHEARRKGAIPTSASSPSREGAGAGEGVLGLTSRDKTPEQPEKGVLRAKHGVYIFKDGTVRYDLTDLPSPTSAPGEVHAYVPPPPGAGYVEDIYGEPLTDGEQVLELLVRTSSSPSTPASTLKVAEFVDEELEKFYGLEPFYKARAPDDPIGCLLVGLAPHTSAGVLCRLIGYTTASAGYGHPFFHAAKRRNCDGDEDCVMLLMDASQLLDVVPSGEEGRQNGRAPRHDHAPRPLGGGRGGPQPRPPLQVPLEFYRATLTGASPKEVEGLIDLVSKRLGMEAQYRGFKFTHDTDDIAAGPKNSAYKTLETMIDKMDAQLALARSIRAVDERDVATRVINSHFLPDLIGNLRAFSRQKVRCVMRGEVPKAALIRRLPQVRWAGDPHRPRGERQKVPGGLDEGRRGVRGRRIHQAEARARSRWTSTLFQNEKSKQTGLADFM